MDEDKPEYFPTSFDISEATGAFRKYLEACRHKRALREVKLLGRQISRTNFLSPHNVSKLIQDASRKACLMTVTSRDERGLPFRTAAGHRA